MNTEHRFILEKGSKKHQCPQCGKRRFVRYIDTVENNYLPEQYGRCDRESKCTYYLNPYLDGYTKALKEQEQGNISEFPKLKAQPKKIQQITEPVFFDFETFKKTLQPESYEMNNFIQNLFRLPFPFGIDEVTKVIQLYRLGTVSHGYRIGANTFPFIDVKGNVRAVQVKQFNDENHTTGTDFLHSIIEKHHARNGELLPEWLRLYKEQDKIVSCLFGEHLLTKFPLSPVALVEAPKTAIYGTLYFAMPESPENLLWLAVYNKSSFNFEKLKVLQGRNVFVFPDLSKEGATFKEWKCKAIEIENKLPGTRFIFSEILEQLATEHDKNKGNDLADILIKHDWRLFRKQKPIAEPQRKEKKPELLKNIENQNRK